MSLDPKPYLQKVMIKPGAQVDFDTYPFSIPAIRNLGELSFHPDVTFFVGENGSGKSTLLEGIALALGFGPEGGTRNVRFETTRSVSPLHTALRLTRSFRKPDDHYFLRAESFFNVATYMDETGYLAGYDYKSLHARSHGESFMTVLSHKLRGNGLYLMDEPEAALSPSRQLTALKLIHDLIQKQSQFIIATHSPILLSYPGARILQFNGEGLTETKFEDTAHFTLTRDYLNNHQRMAARLLAEE